MRSTDNPQGRFCGFHVVFIARHQPAAKSAKPNVGKRGASNCTLLPAPPWRHQTFLRETKGLWYSLSACVDVNSCYHLAFATSRSTPVFTCYHLTQALCVSSEACVSLPLAVTPNLLAAWLLFFLSPPFLSLSPCLSEGRQQVFCDSKIREPRRDGAPLSLAVCVGGGEKNLRFHFQSLSSPCNGRERLSPPPDHKRTSSIPLPVSYPCYMLMYVSYMLSEEPFY